MSTLDIAWVRAQFPALALRVNGSPAAYFDGPGGTQVPQRVIDAMRDYLSSSNANVGRWADRQMGRWAVGR
jgi:selenocysteine lyase/cysteine desulfurase